MTAAGGIAVHGAWVPLRVATRARWLKPAPPAMEGCQASMHVMYNAAARASDCQTRSLRSPSQQNRVLGWTVLGCLPGC